jgi:glyoxylase-like metal-dependent hydrolase (beta-lactamase superfamily II)
MAFPRRSFCLCCVSALAAAGALGSRRARAQAHVIVDEIMTAAARTPITMHRLRGDVTVLEGSGGTVAVVTRPEGKVMIDAGIAVSRPQMATALAALGPAPVTTLINTHWHFDHANGNEWLAELGPRIVAHENTRKHLMSMQRVEDWDYDFPALSQRALPTELFAQDRTMQLHGSTFVLKYYGPAHTDSDISVYIPEADVLHAADTFWNGVYPFIDYSTGGSIDGSIRAAATNLAMTRDSTIIIAGHGSPIGSRAQLQSFHDMLTDVRDRVAALKRQGRSLEEVVLAKPTAPYDAKWGQYVIGPALFAKCLYRNQCATLGWVEWPGEV